MRMKLQFNVLILLDFGPLQESAWLLWLRDKASSNNIILENFQPIIFKSFVLWVCV
jgi:hypothetical protein